MDEESVGRRAAEIRKRRGLSRREFAELAGLSPGQLSRLENGRQGFRSETLIRVAEALSVEPYRLFLPGDGEGRAAGGGRASAVSAARPSPPLAEPQSAAPSWSPGSGRAPAPRQSRGDGPGRPKPRGQALDGALIQALRAPDFVSVLEDIARAHRTSPADFGAVRSVVAAVLGS